MTEMSTEEKLRLFDELIVTAGTLATQADNAAVTLSKDFEDMVRVPIDNVRAVLDKCPLPESVMWDGSLNDRDLTIRVYQSEPQRVQGRPAAAVEMTHAITGLKRKSETHSTEVENTKIARRALEQAVRQRYTEMKRQGRAR